MSFAAREIDRQREIGRERERCEIGRKKSWKNGREKSELEQFSQSHRIEKRKRKMSTYLHKHHG